MAVPTILIVESNPTDLDTMTTQIKDVLNGSVNILSARSIREAKFLFTSNSIDIVVLNLILPDIKGIDALEEIRQINYNIPIIAVLATEDENLALQAVATGAYQLFLREKTKIQQLPLAIVACLEEQRRKSLHLIQLENRINALYSLNKVDTGHVEKMIKDVQDMRKWIYGDVDTKMGLKALIDERKLIINIVSKLVWFSILIAAFVGAIWVYNRFF